LANETKHYNRKQHKKHQQHVNTKNIQIYPQSEPNETKAGFRGWAIALGQVFVLIFQTHFSEQKLKAT